MVTTPTGLLPKISFSTARKIASSVRQRLTGTGLSEDQIDAEINGALARYDVRPDRD
jgi:hypothetical protein